jgi:hypothetical protein
MSWCLIKHGDKITFHIISLLNSFVGVISREIYLNLKHSQLRDIILLIRQSKILSFVPFQIQHCLLHYNSLRKHREVSISSRNHVFLGVKPHLGPTTRFLLLSDICGFVDVGRPLWREDGSQSVVRLAVHLKSVRLDAMPLEVHGQIFFQRNPCSHSPYVICSLTRRWGLSLMNMLGLSSSVRIAHIACYWKFLLVHCIKVLCQSRLRRADHAYLTYLMLQRQLSHLNIHYIYSQFVPHMKHITSPLQSPTG